MAIDFAFEPTVKKSGYIFISYAHKDAQKVAPYVYELHRRGYEVWYDRGINALQSFKEVILKRISTCACFIAFISQNYANSTNCCTETSWATTNGIQRLPVFIEKMDSMPDTLIYDISNVQYLNAYEYNRSDALDIIANRANEILGGKVNDWSDWNDPRVKSHRSTQQEDECGKLTAAARYWIDFYTQNGGEENLTRAKDGYTDAEHKFPYDHRVWLGLIRCETADKRIYEQTPESLDELVCDYGKNYMEALHSKEVSKKFIVYSKLVKSADLFSHIAEKDRHRASDEYLSLIGDMLDAVHEKIKKDSLPYLSDGKSVFVREEELEKYISIITNIVEICSLDSIIGQSQNVQELLKTRFTLMSVQQSIQPELLARRQAKEEEERRLAEIRRAREEEEDRKRQEDYEKRRKAEEEKREIERAIYRKKKIKGKIKNGIKFFFLILLKAFIVLAILSLIFFAVNLFVMAFSGKLGGVDTQARYDSSFYTTRIEYYYNQQLSALLGRDMNVSLQIFSPVINLFHFDEYHVCLPCVLLCIAIILVFALFRYDRNHYNYYDRGFVYYLTKILVVSVYVICAFPVLVYLWHDECELIEPFILNIAFSLVPLILVWCFIPRRAYDTFEPESIPKLIIYHPVGGLIATLGELAIYLVFYIGSCTCGFLCS